ncbi:Sec23-binding domain of Sec16-domain-containing protein [Phyllosticta citrichinensis]|uniref:Protein transport protein sec16 n=1 Tax=Phyllosticta citrichinensis TaxID=1130410 RepID=A0ABR1XVR7_9PEZI
MMDAFRPSGDDQSQSASWHPALRPDSEGAPAPLSTSHVSSTDSPMDATKDGMDSSTIVDDEAVETAPRTSEDCHPLNDGPRFHIEEDDDFFAQRNHAEVEQLVAERLDATTPVPEGAATPLAQPLDPTDEHLTHPTQQFASLSADESNLSMALEQASSAQDEPADIDSTPVVAQDSQPTPDIEHEQPDIETINTEALHQTNPDVEATEDQAQDQHYEHQGETTTLEESVQESAAAPLASTPEAGALNWGDTDADSNLGVSHNNHIAESQPNIVENMQADASQNASPEGKPEAGLGSFDGVTGQTTAGSEEKSPSVNGAAKLDWATTGDEGFDIGLSQRASPDQAEDGPALPQESVLEAPNEDWGSVGGESFPVGEQQISSPPAQEPSEAIPLLGEASEPAISSHEPALDWGNAGEEDFSSVLQAESQRSTGRHHEEAEVPRPIEESSQSQLHWGNPLDADFDIGTNHTNAPDAPASQKTAPEEAQTLDWGTIDGDDFGFDGADASAQDNKRHNASNDEPSASQETEQKPKAEKDLSDLWAEALADDDLEGTSATDPSAFFLDDDEGFLDDPVPQPESGNIQNGSISGVAGAATKYSPSLPPQPVTNPYAPAASSYTSVSQPSVTVPQATPYGSYQNQPNPAPQRPQMPSSAQSFADKSKGGYSSPYDLPEDLAKTAAPRKRVVYAPSAPAGQPKAPPPRSSSVYSNTSSTGPQPPPSNMTTASASPPLSGQLPQTSTFPGASQGVPRPSLSTKPSTGDFFEELPAVSKPRPSGRYTPQVVTPTPPPPSFPPAPPSRQTSQTYASQASNLQQLQRQVSATSQTFTPPPPSQIQRPPSKQYAPPAAATQLQPPERLNPFPDLGESSQKPLPAAPQGPVAASRYSPTPPVASAPASNRYSPAPAAAAPPSKYSPVSTSAPTSAPSAAPHRYSTEPAGPPKAAALPFAPRTSSPLAYHSMPHLEQSQRPSSSGSRSGSIGTPLEDQLGGISRLSLEQVREVPEQERRSGTPPHFVASPVASPPKRIGSNYAPQQPPVMSPGQVASMPPVRRAHSQSPGATMKGPKLQTAQIERPASTNGLASPITSTPNYVAATPSYTAPSAVNTSKTAAQQRRRRTFSRDLSYIKPIDQTAEDQLERWKGAPIFKWGLGGTVLTSFPKAIPRYGTGGTMPMVKCTAGEIRVQKASDMCPLWDPIAKFPGPLKAKGKKKEIVNWLKQGIETMDKDYKSKLFNGELPSDVRVRLEEKILLWRILEIFVEHDGHLEGSDAVTQAVRKVLSSEAQEAEPELSSPVDLMGSAAKTGSAVAGEPIDPQSISIIRNHLYKGDREKAAWDAADKRLWGHAMLIASTLNKDIWKQVVQEFVRQEVRQVAGNNLSLAAVYEIFAGNWEESIDELVPASARAGFQMVSKTDRSGANTNVLDGLDKWRETLLLVVGNRSDGDTQALLALGKLLAGYGRVEASHICYLFARSSLILGGADDASAHVVLLGADHINQRFELGRDIEPILLTEIFEFAVTLSAPAAPPAIPHLQAFKLIHALALAEYGHKYESQAYCEAISASMKATTRISPYYNVALISELEDLIKRLSEAPKDGSSSWISKPSMGKVTGSLFSSFNRFVAGDDDAESNGSGPDASPFAKVAGDTPSVSRSPSVADVYGSMPAGGSSLAPSNAVAGSRYAPSTSPYAPRGSSEEPRSRYAPSQSPYAPTRQSTESERRLEMPMDALFTHQETPPSSYNPSTMYYQPQVPKPQMPYAPSAAAPSQSSPNPLGSPYTPTTAPAFAGYQPLATGPSEENLSTSNGHPTSGGDFGPPLTSSQPQANPYEPPATSYEPPATSYEPPTSSYEPPSYQPYEPDPEPEEDKQPKKNSFMDDDDDELERRAAALKAQQKAEVDRQADEAFRKAAEADAQKGASSKKSSSWLGGWFSKKADDSPKPIRAKLGEENSFYYDTDLKKWVNKKANPADQAAKPAGTPPPPRAGPPGAGLRSAASAMNLGGGPRKGAPTPPLPAMGGSASAGASPNPGLGQRSTSMPPPMGVPSNAGSRTGSPAPPVPGVAPSASGTPSLGGPPSRPLTSMSNASSIDDLLGVPAPRKGAARKKGKAGRYVDVMAK